MINIEIRDGDLLRKIEQGLKDGMWFQHSGEKFYVPPEHIQVFLDGLLGMIMIYFYTEKPYVAMGTYAAAPTYKIRWALKKEDLKEIYEGDPLHE